MRLLTACLIAISVTVRIPDAHGAGDWTRADVAWEAAYLTASALDWSQTLYVAHRPDRFHDRNPVLGRNPSVSTVHRYFLITGAAHLVIAHLLPPKPRRAFQVASTIVRVGVVGSNLHVGAHFDF